MRVKLIALVVASLFAQSAACADDNFMWSGSVEARRPRHEHRRRQPQRRVRHCTRRRRPAARRSPARPTTPRRRSTRTSAARRSASSTSGAAAALLPARVRRGISAATTSSSTSSAAATACGRRSLYNNNIPHNYSFNALTPLGNPSAALLLVGPGGPIRRRRTRRPGTRSTTAPSATPGAATSSSRARRRGSSAPTTTRSRRPASSRSSGQLGTGSGNGLIELGVPVDYKTQNTTIEGGYNSRQYGSSSRSRLEVHRQQRHGAVDELLHAQRARHSLLPPDNELKKWSFNGYIKQLPWDSAIICALHAEQADEQRGSGRRLRRHAVEQRPQADGEQRPCQPILQPTGVGYLVTAPNSSNFDGDIKTTTAQRRVEREPDGAARHAGLLRLLRPENDSTPSRTRQGSQGTELRDRPPANSATCLQHRAR